MQGYELSSVCFLVGEERRPQHLHTSPTLAQVYTPKRRTLIQVLPPANVYTKLFATCSCIFTYPFVGNSYIYAIRPVCVYHGVRIGCLIAILRQNEYMHEQITKEFEGRKYLYECTPIGYENLCKWHTGFDFSCQNWMKRPNFWHLFTPIGLFTFSMAGMLMSHSIISKYN